MRIPFDDINDLLGMPRMTPEMMDDSYIPQHLMEQPEPDLPDPTLPEYKIVERIGYGGLVRIVNHLIQCGWEVQGGVTVAPERYGDHKYCQALMKPGTPAIIVPPEPPTSHFDEDLFID